MTETEMLVEPRAGPCDPRREIEAWIDELLDLRLEMEGNRALVAEIDHHLQRAVEWLAESEAGRLCA